MNKVILSLLISFCAITVTRAQNKVIYHVVSKKTSLRASDQPHAKELLKLKMYNNLELLAMQEGDAWARVRYQGHKGYVLREDIALGKAEMKVQMVRVGAICRDGTSSKATGRGACSGHGGVRRWKTKRQETVEILDNQ